MIKTKSISTSPLTIKRVQVELNVAESIELSKRLAETTLIGMDHPNIPVSRLLNRTMLLELRYLSPKRTDTLLGLLQTG